MNQMPPNTTFLSLGAGVQSSVMALMAARGELTPMPQAAIFADTGDEPKSVYAWLTWLETQLPFPVHRVQRGILSVDAVKVVRSKKSGNLYMKGLIPAFVKGEDGGVSLLGRKCTSSYKIDVILTQMRNLVRPQLLSYRRACSRHKKYSAAYEATVGGPYPKPSPSPIVHQWIGITTDEAHRMKPSRHPWLESQWPLIEKSMSRNDCLRWMREHGYPEPPRSACRYCPFHSDEEWLRQKTEEPEEFEKSVAFERALQEAARKQTALKGVPWLTRRCVPLDSIQFHDQPGKQQVSLFGNECEGLCGV